MYKQEILAHFGGVIQTSIVFNMTKGAVSKWPEDKPVPENIALLAERYSDGELEYDPELYGRSPDNE